jgi:PASTA domain
MSPTSSPPAFADPLAQEDTPLTQRPPRTRRPSATNERAALIAPDVEGHLGAEAIDLVRSRGLIAAIEPVEITASAQRGLVVEQDPSAGTQMVREGVVTLRVGQSPASLPCTEDAAGDRLASRIAGGNGSEDDTAEWFAMLRPSPGAPALGPGAVAPRRRRKHRRAASPAEGMAFDTPPDPLPAVSDPLPAEQRNLSQPVRLGLPTSAIALLVRLAMLSVSPAWRRRTLVLAGVLVSVVVFTWGGGAHSHHQALAPVQISAPLVRTARTPALPRSSSAQRTLDGRHTSSRLTARVRRPLSKRVPRKALVASTRVVAQATAKSTSPADLSVTSAPPAARPPSARVTRPGRFSYLGQ